MKSLVLCLLASPLLALDARPIRIFHWLNPLCLTLYSNNGGKCVPTTEGLDAIFVPFEQQAQTGCNALKAEIDQLQDGFHIVAYSLSGFVVRTMLHTCPEVTKLVRRVAFVNVPHLGFEKIPDFAILERIIGSKEELLDISIKDIKQILPKISTLQASIGVIAYKTIIGANKHKLGEIQAVLRFAINGQISNAQEAWVESTPINQIHTRNGAGTPFLKELNDPKWGPIYSKLEMVVNVKSKHDNISIPSLTTLMGADITADEKITDFAETAFAKKHARGFGGLFRRGKMFNCLSAGIPELLQRDEAKAIYKVLLGESAGESTSAASAKAQATEFLKVYPEYCNAVVAN